MRGIIASMALAVAGAAGIAASPAEARSRAEIERCAALQPIDERQIVRQTGVEIPRNPRGLRRALERTIDSNRQVLAVETLSGKTYCLDIRRMASISKLDMKQDGRFVTFDWEGYAPNGYRSDGAILIDRWGDGRHVDVGGTPGFSPSGQLVAAVHQSNYAFTALEGLGIWRISPGGIEEVAHVINMPQLLDWRVDGWRGENCLILSGVRFSSVPLEVGDLSQYQRLQYVARQNGASWEVTYAQTGGCPG
ncbi:hypothetical protein GCM10011371_19750 [Novosphingobium marinum]|uniref:Uncharacterized protein n=1 Tax=Novosphingobium marinum TaxID=1514948 RepID=A0A7Y9XZQ8_9SPHN|nr:hypothetical protein [Novosphingobium marinum]NYH96088.1 hypothetical protein [Novosphingobium marinum]GGC32371.1 hypothetical protein GCM10011371_19750 [Novosphingobium marinum]